MANEPRNLYANPDFFRLTVIGQPYYVEEPFRWDEIKIKLARDETYIGFNYEFVDDEIKPIFKPGAGAELLAGVYELQGGDAPVMFEYGYSIKGVKYVQFAGNVNMNTYHRDDQGVQVTIEKIQFENLLRTRWDTKVDFTSTVDYNNNPIVPLLPMQIDLHSKEILKAARAEADKAGLPTQQLIDDNAVWIQPDTSILAKDEIQEFFPTLVGVSANANGPDVENRNQFLVKESGRLKWSWTGSFRLEVRGEGPFADPIGDWYLQPKIWVKRAGAFIVMLDPPAPARYSGHSDSKNFQLDVNINLNGIFDLLKDDEVYWHLYFHTEFHALRLWRVVNYQGVIEMSQQTVAPSSQCNGYKFIDAVNYIVKYITGVDNAVASVFHGNLGAAEKFLVTNGYQIRNFDIANKPFRCSLKELLEMANSLWMDAIQYTKDLVSGKTLVRIEPAGHLMQGKPIIHIEELYDYEEDHSSRVTFNELEVGYNKFPEDDLNTLDEYNTYGTWLTPITSYKKKYTKRTNAIASGYYIEQVRREQFRENPSASKSGDDDLFIIAYNTERIYRGIGMELGGEFARFLNPVGLRVGDTFRVFRIGSPNPGTVFTVEAIDFSVTEKYKISPNAVAEAGIGNLEILINRPVAERNEAFSTVGNLISPETAYNLRLSPRRILYNHSAWINAGLHKKDPTELIRLTDFKNNKELVTQFRVTEPNILTTQNYLLKEGDSFPLSDFNDNESLFIGREASFKCGMTYRDFVLLRDALMHQSGTDKDGGTITFRDPRTKVNWEGVPIEVHYEPKPGVASIILWKKKPI